MRNQSYHDSTPLLKIFKCLYYVLLGWLSLLMAMWVSGVQCPVLNSTAQVLQTQAMASFMKSVYLVFSLPLSLWPSIFPNIIVFSKAPCLLMMWEVKTASGRDPSGLICSGTHPFIYLKVQDIHRALLQEHTSSESYFFPISLIYCSIFTSKHSNWNKRMWMILAWVSRNTSLLMMTSPNCSIAAFSSLSLVLISWQ